MRWAEATSDQIDNFIRANYARMTAPEIASRLKPVTIATRPPMSPWKNCQWPVSGEGRTMVKCGEKSKPGHSWCDCHCARAYA